MARRCFRRGIASSRNSHASSRSISSNGIDEVVMLQALEMLGYTLLARATGGDQRAQPDGQNPNFAAM
jgi:hypothetical protein